MSSWRPRSDSYGDFEFEGLDKNKAYTITVKLDGYAPKIFEITTHTDVNLGEIVLERVSDYAARVHPRLREKELM